MGGGRRRTDRGELGTRKEQLLQGWKKNSRVLERERESWGNLSLSLSLISSANGIGRGTDQSGREKEGCKKERANRFLEHLVIQHVHAKEGEEMGDRWVKGKEGRNGSLQFSSSSPPILNATMSKFGLATILPCSMIKGS